jgi:hypothetical protein
MILGRPVSSWNGLVAALAAFVIVAVKQYDPTVDVTQLVGSVVVVAAAVFALLANQATNGTLLGRRR